MRRDPPMCADPLGPPVAAEAEVTSMERRMDERRTLRGSALENLLQLLKPHATLVALTALAAALVILLASFTPRPLFLPVLSLAAIAVAGLAALLAWACRAQWRGDDITIWDISGAFALIGFAAGMLSKPEHVVQLLGLATTTQ